MEENDVLGFDPQNLSVNAPKENNFGNSNIYKPKPALSKSNDGIYRSTIKVIYNPFDLKNSVVEQQYYAMHDSNGWFNAISSLTVDDFNCPIFRAWQACKNSNDPMVKAAATPVSKGGKGIFDKRFSRYVLIQVMEDENQPELVGKYMLWKCPQFVWDIIQAKQNPADRDKKSSIPVMDFLFGRAVELEVKPGEDDPNDAGRKNREISYKTSEISEDPMSCTNPDGSPLLNDEEQEVLDEYITLAKKVWKAKDPATRADANEALMSSDACTKLRAIYKKVIAEIKTFCPNLIDEMGYKPWDAELSARVKAWLDIAVTGNDPAVPVPAAAQTVGQDAAKAPAEPVATPTPASNTPGADDDLPF